MLSNLLAQLFRVGYIFGFLGLVISFTCQLINKPIRFNTGKDSYISIGNAGLKAMAKRSNMKEQAAPETIINYRVIDSNNVVLTNGIVPLLLSERSPLFRKRFDEVLDAKRDSSKKLEIDTVFHFIGQDHIWDIPQGSRDQYTDSVNNKSFSSSAEAVRYSTMRMYYPVNQISQDGGMTEQLRIMPANGWQRAGFILYDLVRNATYVLLMLFLSRLFFHFSKRRYFTVDNVNLVLRTGWLLLIPPVASLIMYYGFLMNLRPVKVVMAGETDSGMVASYEFSSDLNWTLIFLGVGLLVLSLIFKDGLKMKEEEEYTL